MSPHRVDSPTSVTRTEISITYPLSDDMLYGLKMIFGSQSQYIKYIHCVPPKKRSHFYFLNNYIKNEPILIIFGTLNPERT